MSNVLIVDDDPSMRDLCRLIAKRQGLPALAAHSGTEAEALALQHQPVLILMDLGLPGQDGAETCRRLRSRGYGGQITLMSTLQDSVGVERAKGCGANNYLAKLNIYHGLIGLMNAAAEQSTSSQLTGGPMG